MALSSQKYAFDDRLLSVEELLRHRKYAVAQRELENLSESSFRDVEHEHGLFLALTAESNGWAGNYRKALELGLPAAKILADYPLNQRYGRILLVLSKAYSALGDLKNAEIRARDGLASFRRAGDQLGQVDGLNELARIAFIRNDYQAASSFLADAMSMVSDNPRKTAQLTGNLGRIRLLAGQWAQAQENLEMALSYHESHGEDLSILANRLSVGYLHLRRREFSSAARELDKSYTIIQKLDLRREKVIYLEYAGELAFEKGDIHRAKVLLNDAYQQGRLLAPESSLVSQASRRLAEAELAMDNVDEAMKYAQKALELSRHLGERTETGLALRAIASVFSARGDHDDALEYVTQSLEILREVGDPYDVARTLLASAAIREEAGAETADKVRAAYDEAIRIFKRLKLDFWVAETDFRAGACACRQGDLSWGFRRLSRSEKLFALHDEKAKVRSVNQFLHALADQAVALSVSDENEFKLFGNFISSEEVKTLQAGRFEDILQTLLRKCNANRAVIYSPGFDAQPVVASFAISPHQASRFVENFKDLLGEELAVNRPTLKLDCRRDPYINGLLPDTPEQVASVIVVPFRNGDGTTDFLYLDKLSVDNALNPFSQSELNFAVGFSDLIAFKSAELQKLKLLEDNRRLKAQLMEQASFPSIITRNAQLLQVLAQVRRIVDSTISIMIEGETGTGKDLLSRAIHYNSTRRAKRLISINCAALPETLLESELFGFKRGAFTGADRDKVGLLEEADGGTFFLDEVADMPLSIQAKVLRVLEDKEIVRLGETVSRKVDVRILSATNKDLKGQMAGGLFRQDLYYRLTALSFRLPPLRERKEDIPHLVSHFLEETHKTMEPEVLRHLIAYDWPGNIRELENEVKKMAILSGDNSVIATDLLSAKLLDGRHADSSQSAPETGGVDEIAFNETYSLYDYLAAWEKRFIVRALREQNGIKKHAAALLNIPESTLRLKIKQYDIDLDRLDMIN